MQLIASFTFFQDTQTLLVAILAVFLVGLSKGGLGGAFALMGVPILALVMPPMQAAALLLPILLMMDAISVWTWRGWFDRATLWHLLPAAFVGIAVGALTAAITSEAFVRLIVGLLALGFVMRMTVMRAGALPRGQRWVSGSFWGAFAGFTSFVAHAGGPPFQVYALPLRLDPRLFTGTSVIFFAVVNLVKVAPYAALGHFDTKTLLSAAVMLPLAAVSTVLGAKVIQRINAQVFYPFMYITLTLVGGKLVWDGVSGFWL
ncbi:hypothetical protein LY56_01272 [Roseinatronobacter thiooxidans]|uniref:Probable membrane transporter protein n=1 Tax=Roseinatronobacter thiooxidans TaxID=121821 RepID=A0A2W7QX90_9RHOB|nr:sulfite exporter TauE/SafE family protein [Roseinatronobacter thiooxidans]PZX46299.1 hypothetical protein LY56_01272 [Roseinatronobacter thiooxidans]